MLATKKQVSLESAESVTRAFQAEMGVMEDGRTAFSDKHSIRMGIGSSDRSLDKTAVKHQKLHHMLQMASSTSVPVSGVALTAKTG